MINSSNSIDIFYDTPIKYGDDGSKHLINLSSLRRDEVDVLFKVVEEFKPQKTLEVGLSLAASCVAIITAKQRVGITYKHVALDPFQATATKNAGLLELKRLALADNLEFKSEFSEVFLADCLNKNQQFDFVFIDGSHTIGQAVTDVFLADKVLNQHGIIAIHDAMLFSTAASVKYLLDERNYQLVLKSRYNYKVLGRMIKYSFKLGLSYCLKVVPRIQTSLVVLQKR